MKDERSTTVYVATEEKPINVTYIVNETAEDLCITICKLLNIGPVARRLFALRTYSSKFWFEDGYKLEAREKNKFEFRLRFKPCSMQKLKQIDEQAYNYYFQQVRADIMNNKVPDIVYEKHKDELIGLGVSDMYRVMLEKQVPQATVESDYKKYIPKECIKRHAFFVKKPIYNALAGISKEHLDASYVKEQYLQQFESMAPNYLYEEYTASMEKNALDPSTKVLLRVNREEIKYCESSNDDWKTLCTIEDLCFISIDRNDNTVNIARKTGQPTILTFKEHTKRMLISFVTVLDGYYRLSIKWTFNLCKEVITPSLDRLYKLKCHGPVGKAFSYAKLKEKRANKPGTYILRESETEYDVYYIDVCNKAGKPQSYKMEKSDENKFLISDLCTQSYFGESSLESLHSFHQNSTNSLYLEECLPPSEYDISPLLICASENIASELAADEEIISLLEGGPRCVSQNQLQIYKVFCKNNQNFTPTTWATSVHQAIWRIAKDKKLEIVMKILKNSSYTKEFLELTDKWSKLRSGNLIRLYGITVAPSIGMLLELVKLGPLDKYLRNNTQIVKIADMVEAAACLTKALWHLEENHVVHGRIRCRRVFVHVHTDSSFIVKLGDPGIFTYTEIDIPWIPPECYADLASAKKNFQADVWALATTIWEIFSRGASIPTYHNIDAVKLFYQKTHLPKPDDCPNEIYKVMKECWNEKNKRKRPQAIMRDINQILHQVFNSRRIHAYATAVPKLNMNGDENKDEDLEERTSNSGSYMSSSVTNHTNLTWSDNDDNSMEIFTRYEDCVNDAMKMRISNGDSHPIRGGCYGRMMRFHNGNTKASINQCSFNNFLGQMQDISAGGDWNVFIHERIGQGFYGEVYKGTRVRNKEIEQIAIKKLKNAETETERNDFEREIEIMKTLDHPNIVKILGNMSDPEKCLIMEFIEHGSLQNYLVMHRMTLRSNHKRLLHFALDIATGMNYLGKKNIVHRDLAARNILVANEDLVKISDFGLAQKNDGNDYYVLQTIRNLPMKWHAPESLGKEISLKFSTRSDVWSFGVTMYEIFSLGEDPNLPMTDLSYQTITEEKGDIEGNVGKRLLAAYESGIRLPCPDNCPQEVYRQLMYQCWNMNSHKRPSFATLCECIQELLEEY
ncbi:tyrosine-protein kinase hopscotch [Anoplolepis gracilipes]|uniref:tyrosine-protein kinase hopscotch n=1 Tax=Anoplolepis gracilipes TaxID=354296 RepID=UPI003BA3CA0D